MTTPRLKKRGESAECKKTAQTGRFGRWLGCLMLTGVLGCTPNFINNKGGNIVMAETKTVTVKKSSIIKLQEMAKEAAYSFLELIKTGNSKEMEKFNKILNTEIEGKQAKSYKEFSKAFLSVLENRAPGDPGLRNFLTAYMGQYDLTKEYFKPAHIMGVVYGLFSAESLGKAEEKYGKKLTYAFLNLVTWRLAAHAVNVSLEALHPEKTAEAKKDLERIAGKLLGKPTTEYEHFYLTYNELLGKKIKSVEGLAELWDAYEVYLEGGDATMLGLIDEAQSCSKLIKTKGAEKAMEQYPEDFVNGVIAVTKVEEKKKIAVPTKIEKVAAAEEMVKLFDEGRLDELVASMELTEKNNIGAKMETESERIKAFEELFNRLLSGNEEFREFVKDSKYKGLKKLIKKKKGIAVDGNYPTARTPIAALNAFLVGKAEEGTLKTSMVDAGVYPGLLKKGDELGAASLRAMAVFLGIEPKVIKAAPLEEQVEVLSGAESVFYIQNVKDWLEKKQAEGYVIYDLKGIMDFLMTDVSKGELKTPIDSKKLDGRLKNLVSGGFMQLKEIAEFKPSQVANALLEGEGIGDALKILVIGQGAVESKSEEVKIAALELVLNSFITNIDSYIPDEEFAEHVEKLKAIKIVIDGKYAGDVEADAVRALQEFLFDYAKANDDFHVALREMGMDYLTALKTTGKFNENTAKAFAAYVALQKGTWKSEKKDLIKGAKPTKPSGPVLPFE